jgi:hypothetical protein
MPNDDDIRAKTPDGVIHRFPGGTPPAVVDGAIKKYLSTKSTGVDVGELQQRTLGQARATAAAPIVSGELNNPASPNFNRPLPASFEGKPENIGEYIPASAGEMAGGAADIGRGDIAKGTHRIIGGASNALLPVLPFAGAAAPALTARTLAGGAAGQYAGRGLGEGLGLSPDQTDLAGDIGGLVGGGVGAKARVPSRADVALALRNPDTGALKPSVKVGSAAAGAGAGYLTGAHGFGEFGGMYLGPKIADALVPKLPSEMPVRGIGASLPSADEFYNIRGDELLARGKAQEALDANFVRQGKAVPLRNSPLATQNEAQAAFDRGEPGAFTALSQSPIPKPTPQVGSPENPGFMARLPTRMPLKKALAPNFFEGATPTNVPLGNARLPEVPQGNPTPFAPTVPHEIPGINAPAGQDLISRTRRISIPGEEPTTADLKRAGDLTQAPLQRLKSLARFGDRLAQIEINRRLKNE